MGSNKLNDFSIHVATVNGSGSQSSNNVLMRSIFRMGIPVSGKNLFPSNIQGLPTWFTIRVSEEAWTARKVDYDLLVCMNDATYAQDVQSIPAGSLVVHHEHMRVGELRKDVVSIPVPFKKIIAEACPDPRLRKLAINMVYVGVVAELIGIETSAVEEAMAQQFNSKQKVIDLNMSAFTAGKSYAQQELSAVQSPLALERRDLTSGKILIEGNNAAALGAIFGGCHFVSWYPITPSSSLVESFISLAEKYRIDKTTGKSNAVVVQAEDEIAALGMVLGAGWMGARAMTSTSGPGISLMAEFAGYGYFSEIPAVIFDVQRVGPSTGLPTRTSQADLLCLAYLGHGDTQHPVLLPGTVEECYRFSAQAFELSEQLQTPVFVASDLDLGMNSWMSEPFEYLDDVFDRGKVLTEEDQEKLKDFGRYKDEDGDGIPYRTLPGIKDSRGVYFTRGSGHDENANYTESSEAYVRLMKRLKLKFETAKEKVPAPVLETNHSSSIGVVCYGSSHEAMREAVHKLVNAGMPVDYLRLRAFPFNDDLKEFLEAHQRVYIVEQNRDAQLRSLIAMEPQLQVFAPKLRSVLHFDGLPIPASFITEQILYAEKPQKLASA